MKKIKLYSDFTLLEKIFIFICVLVVWFSLYYSLKLENNCEKWSTCQLKRDCTVVWKTQWKANVWFWQIWWTFWTVTTFSSWYTTYNCNWVIYIK